MLLLFHGMFRLVFLFQILASTFGVFGMRVACALRFFGCAGGRFKGVGIFISGCRAPLLKRLGENVTIGSVFLEGKPPAYCSQGNGGHRIPMYIRP